MKARLEALTKGLEQAIVAAVRAALEGLSARPKIKGKAVKLDPQQLGKMLLGQLGGDSVAELAAALGREKVGKKQAAATTRKQPKPKAPRKPPASQPKPKAPRKPSARARARAR